MDKTEKKMGRPRQDEAELKDNITLRIHPSKRVKIGRAYGNQIQPFFDEAVDKKVQELDAKWAQEEE